MSYFLDTTETIPDGLGFGHFDSVHLLWLGFFLILSVICIVWYRGSGENGRKIWKKTVAALLVADELFKVIMLVIGKRYHAGYLPLHLCSIFANLLDNAIRGAEECGRKPSSISLTSAVAGDYLLIKTVNPANPPQTPKPGHGYGSRILAELAEQYEGSFQSSYENGVYTAVVSLLIGNET